MKLLRHFVLACALAMISASASAGLFVCNNVAQTVSIAIGWHHQGTWVSKGWANVPPRECKALLLGRLANRYYYYFAESEDGLLKWTSSHGAHFCTTNAPFRIKQGSSDDCDGEIFNKVDVGDADQYTFSLSEHKDPAIAAARCASARASGIDQFSKCWINGVATSKQRQILGCIDNTASKASLAICAMGAHGQIDGKELQVATCADRYAVQKRGDQFLDCIASGNLNEKEARAFQCAVENRGVADTASCLAAGSLTAEQRRLVKCASDNGSDALSAGICAAGKLDEAQMRALECAAGNDEPAAIAACLATENLTSDQKRIVSCVSQNKGDYAMAGLCAAGNLSEDQTRAFQCVRENTAVAGTAACLAGSSLTNEQQKVLSCVRENRNNYVRAGLCAAAGSLTPEQNRVASCVLNSRASYLQMGVCATGSNLTPEQQVFANCAISTGAQPYAFAGCVGTQLTMNELQKCITIGVGGSGCFGDNNTAVVFVRNAWKDVTEGPGPSNDLLGQDGWVGRKMQDVANDLSRGAGNTNDVVGADGWLCVALFGGCD